LIDAPLDLDRPQDDLLSRQLSWAIKTVDDIALDIEQCRDMFELALVVLHILALVVLHNTRR
jgi:hypothetical protein